MRPTDPHGRGGAPPVPHHYTPAELHNDDVAHEETDIDLRSLLLFSGGLAAVVAVVAVLMYGVFALFERRAQQNDPVLSPLAAPAVQMPNRTTESPYFGAAKSPQLLTNEYVLLEQVRERERQQLSSYGWVDQASGVARMPIAEAKKLVAERGLPVRADGQADPRAGSYTPVRGESSGGRTITVPPAEAVQAPGQPTGAAPAPQKPH
ncbi:MAG TPA: hypothetical protein VD833_00290 [Vicinamibacterales bacterium]|nr:hypothetical protein [Vicinamibacterales bacterium]